MFKHGVDDHKETLKEYRRKAKRECKDKLKHDQELLAKGIPYVYKIEYRGTEYSIIEDAYLTVYDPRKKASKRVFFDDRFWRTACSKYPNFMKGLLSIVPENDTSYKNSVKQHRPKEVTRTGFDFHGGNNGREYLIDDITTFLQALEKDRTSASNTASIKYDYPDFQEDFDYLIDILNRESNINNLSMNASFKYNCIHYYGKTSN